MDDQRDGREGCGRETWNAMTDQRAAEPDSLTLWTADVDLRPRDHGANVNPTAHKYTVSHQPTEAISIATSRPNEFSVENLQKSCASIYRKKSIYRF